MKNPTLVATILTVITIGALCGMLVCGGLLDILFFFLAVLPLVWGIVGAIRSRRSQ